VEYEKGNNDAGSGECETLHCWGTGFMTATCVSGSGRKLRGPQRCGRSLKERLTTTKISRDKKRVGWDKKEKLNGNLRRIPIKENSCALPPRKTDSWTEALPRRVVEIERKGKKRVVENAESDGERGTTKAHLS